MQVGFSGYRDVLYPANSAKIGETIVDGYAVLARSNFEWLNEGLVIRHALSGAPHVFDTPGFYSQISERFGSYRPYFRYQYVNAPSNEPVFGDVGLRSGPSVGVRYDANESVALKLQYDSPSSMRKRLRRSMAIRAVLVGTMLLLAFRFTPFVDATAELQERRGGPEQSLAIVVNRANPVNNLSFSELRKVFLGRRSHWPNGRRIAVAMLDYGQPEREAVLEQIYKMDENNYRNYFLRGMFRGEVFMSPKTLATPIIVKKFVFNAPGGIGYIRASEVDGTVKVLRIDGHLPEDKDYILQIDAAR